MQLGAKRRHKFNAVPTVVDGIRFHSKRESERYRELRLLELAGSIRNVILQPPYKLNVTTIRRFMYGDTTQTYCGQKCIGTYRADFQYEELTETGGRWDVVVEDVKGYDTPLSKWKRRHVAAQYGIQVRVVR